MATAESLLSKKSARTSDNGGASTETSKPLIRESSSDNPSSPNTLTPSQVAYVGEDVECIPGHLIVEKSHIAQRLDVSYNRLNTLDGLDQFTLLEELVLDNNLLTDESLRRLPKLPRLKTLTANKNKITDTEQLLGILVKNTPNLRYLSLLGNHACPNELLGDDHDDKDYQRYRYYVLYKLPQLTFLDSRPVSSEERKEAKRVGQFMRVVKPPSDVLEARDKRRRAEESQYTPLPQSADMAGQHKGVFGQCKYVYYGKHSEGNRFIRNNQL
ncbi:leucine-rich melanocyte differentiation-associated protein-like [Halichondria panicea]|uniref:leucine-rich melanocyte differentiation-associated protein-like n=1 Tax=Halichondria panicea TaxID=6063 RepID=UPI00312BA21A